MAAFTEVQIKELMNTARMLDQAVRRYQRYEESVELDADAGVNVYPFSRVGTDRILVITHMSAYNAISACTYIRLGFFNRTRNVWPRIEPAPLVLETVEFNGELTLQEDMWPVVQFDGATLHDDLHILVEGYWVRAPRIS
uniref:Uncharacterized protein n=1 Tax=viral metagenome TaxID=1070528 RepID=A0A6H1ZUM3_9ZZZZ